MAVEVSVDGVKRSLAIGDIPVTSANNGQFLRVVDGAWAASAVPSAEEASF